MSLLLRVVALVCFLLVVLSSVGWIDGYSDRDMLGLIGAGLLAAVGAAIFEKPVQP